ncbi:hypothetical protein VTK56DRAFT_8547 [Thermocarpiscus australiensis]
MLLRREDKDCSPQPGVNLCEKPGISSSTRTWIVVGAVLGALLIGTLSVLAILTIRRRKRDKLEDRDDRFQMSDYGLDELPSSSSSRKPRGREDDGGMKRSPDGSPYGYGRQSRDALHAGAEPKYHGGRSNGHLSPFDDAASVRSGNGPSDPPSVNQQWPKREGSHLNAPAQGK